MFLPGLYVRDEHFLIHTFIILWENIQSQYTLSTQLTHTVSSSVQNQHYNTNGPEKEPRKKKVRKVCLGTIVILIMIFLSLLLSSIKY